MCLKSYLSRRKNVLASHDDAKRTFFSSHVAVFLWARHFARCRCKRPLKRPKRTPKRKWFQIRTAEAKFIKVKDWSLVLGMYFVSTSSLFAYFKQVTRIAHRTEQQLKEELSLEVQLMILLKFRPLVTPLVIMVLNFSLFYVVKDAWLFSPFSPSVDIFYTPILGSSSFGAVFIRILAVFYTTASNSILCRANFVSAFFFFGPEEISNVRVVLKILGLKQILDLFRKNLPNFLHRLKTYFRLVNRGGQSHIEAFWNYPHS